MAARRLIAVMLVLLFLSSLAAALAPVERPSEEPTTTTTETVPSAAPGQGELIREVIDARAPRPRTIEAKVGDQLQLRVTGRRPATIELAGLGPTDDLDPLAPAMFDVLLNTKGSYAVRELESGRKIGTIEVSPRRAPKEPALDPARVRS